MGADPAPTYIIHTALFATPCRDQGDAANQQFFLQFITKYLHWTGELRCRVTTVTRRWIDGSNVAEVITGGLPSASAAKNCNGGKVGARPTSATPANVPKAEL